MPRPRSKTKLLRPETKLPWTQRLEEEAQREEDKAEEMAIQEILKEIEDDEKRAYAQNERVAEKEKEEPEKPNENVCEEPPPCVFKFVDYPRLTFRDDGRRY